MQAQRIQIARQTQLDMKKQLAKNLADIDNGAVDEISSDLSEYFTRVFRIPGSVGV